MVLPREGAIAPVERHGLTAPTSKQWGETSYSSGMLVVFRGERCAKEDYVSDAQIAKGDLGPCGYGEHDDAYYQWGIDGDPNKDVGTLRHTGADDTLVFDYKDNWQLPAPIQARLDSQRQAEQAQRELFAKLLQQRLTATGFEISVSPSSDPKDELRLDSDMFKDTPTRVQFVNDVLPHWRPDLCKAGFHKVRLTKGGFLESGQSYLWVADSGREVEIQRISPSSFSRKEVVVESGSDGARK